MATWQTRGQAARGFWDVAELAHGGQHVNQAAANAILAVIAANDAICMKLGRPQPKNQSHAEAARDLQAACRGTGFEREAAERSRQLVEILRHKNAAQYNSSPLTRDVAERIMTQAGRFIAWAETVVAT
jgi:hypothetical protein